MPSGSKRRSAPIPACAASPPFSSRSPKPRFAGGPATGGPPRVARARRVRRTASPLTPDLPLVKPADALGAEARFRQRPPQRRVLGLKLRDAAGGGVQAVLPLRAPGAARFVGCRIGHGRAAGGRVGV